MFLVLFNNLKKYQIGRPKGLPMKSHALHGIEGYVIQLELCGVKFISFRPALSTESGLAPPAPVFPLYLRRIAKL